MTKKICAFFLITLFIFGGHISAVENFAVFTFPKGGTHLLIKFFRYDLFNTLNPTGDPEKGLKNPKLYFNTHFHDPQLPDFRNRLPCKTLLCIRDMRDVALSQVEWFSSIRVSPFSSAGIVDQKLWFTLSKTDKLKALLTPEIWGQSFLLENCEALRSWISLLDNEKVYVTFFEKLVGPKGGGNLEDQEREIVNISNFIGLQPDQHTVDFIASDLYGNTSTFRHGQIARWKTIFDEELMQLAQFHMSDLLDFFEYEN